MPKEIIKKWLPKRETLAQNKYLEPLTKHAHLWHFNRRSCSWAFAVGLFAGLLPFPLQIIGAGLLAGVFSANLPLAILLTWYSNPLTIVPLYALAYKIGYFVLGGASPSEVKPYQFNWSSWSFVEQVVLIQNWLSNSGPSFLLGAFILGLILGVIGFAASRLFWRFYLVRQYRLRKSHRNTI